MSSTETAHESNTVDPLGTRPLEIQQAAQEIIDGEREATEEQLVVTFRLCIDLHYLSERDYVLRALNEVQKSNQERQ